MRKIKFKAYIKEFNEIHEVVDLKWGGKYFSVLVKDCFDYFKPGEYELLEYTGLRDIDGKEIYEGDIVNQKATLLGDNDVDITGVVTFSEGAWLIEDRENRTAEILFSEHRKNRILGNYFVKETNNE